MITISTLYEAKRHELISKSTSSAKGTERFHKRKKSNIANTVKAMNSIDMNKLFKEDILNVGIPVHGETDDYTVTISFGGFLELLQKEIKKSNQVSFREISRAAIEGFNRDDIYVSCTCPDNIYRFAYYATKNDYNSGAPETRPSKITNPDDTLGSSCKHILLVLNNTSWMLRVARTIANYIKYMEQHYQKMYYDVIYPAIYGEEYAEPVQTSLFDKDTLDTDKDTIDAANRWNQNRTKFQPGNQKGMRFTSKPDPNQLDMETNPDDIL